jgi:hypothetical protein
MGVMEGWWGEGKSSPTQASQFQNSCTISLNFIPLLTKLDHLNFISFTNFNVGTAIGQCAFSSTSPAAYNTIPLSTRSAPLVHSFKQQIETLFFSTVHLFQANLLDHGTLSSYYYCIVLIYVIYVCFKNFCDSFM